jgi:tRNA A37 threonylcarbamoyladenosine synthetase subunit TsaC/SUA5/YrdC
VDDDEGFRALVVAVLEHCGYELVEAATGEEALEAARALGGDGAVMVLDAGRLAPSAPSTVVDCTGPAPRMVRTGAVPLTELRQAVGSLAP